MTTPFFQAVWKGRIENTPPEINTEKLKDLIDGLRAAGGLVEEVRRVNQILGIGGEMKPSELFEEANKILDGAQSFSSKITSNPASAGEQIKTIKDAIKESFELVEMVTEGRMKNETKPETKERRFSVTEDGLIIQDDDGDFTFKEAIQIASLKRQNKGHVYYYQDPSTGEFKKADGPVFLQHKIPETWYIDTDGNVRRLEAGQPIVFSKREKPKVYLISPGGEVTEYEEGKPIIIKVEKLEKPEPLFQLFDRDGNPIKFSREALELQLNLWERLDKMRRDEERHKHTLELITKIRENIPDIIGAAKDAVDGLRGREFAGKPGFIAYCAWCNEKHHLKEGTKIFTCQKCGKESEVE